MRLLRQVQRRGRHLGLVRGRRDQGLVGEIIVRKVRVLLLHLVYPHPEFVAGGVEILHQHERMGGIVGGLADFRIRPGVVAVQVIVPQGIGGGRPGRHLGETARGSHQPVFFVGVVAGLRRVVLYIDRRLLDAGRVVGRGLRHHVGEQTARAIGGDAGDGRGDHLVLPRRIDAFAAELAGDDDAAQAFRRVCRPAGQVGARRMRPENFVGLGRIFIPDHDHALLGRGARMQVDRNDGTRQGGAVDHNFRQLGRTQLVHVIHFLDGQSVEQRRVVHAGIVARVFEFQGSRA